MRVITAIVFIIWQGILASAQNRPIDNVPIDFVAETPKTVLCPVNQVPGCAPCDTCERALATTLQPECVVFCAENACRCAEGYHFDSKGNCVSLNECKNLAAPQIIDPDFPQRNCSAEDPTTVNGCKGCATCTAQIDHQVNGTFCPIPPCLPTTCTCKYGYFYDDIKGTGKCIPYSQCLVLAGVNATTKKPKPRPCG